MTAGSLTLTVRLTPKGGRDEFSGIETISDGVRFSRRPTCNVTLAAEATARVKRLAIAGNPAALLAALEKIAVLR